MSSDKQKRSHVARQLTAKLRVCASCEWIFSDQRHPETGGCPACGFAHYGARFVYGDAAYKFAKTQKPWFDKRMADYAYKLHCEMRDLQPRIDTAVNLPHNAST